jgi:hypothetical protein
MNESTTPITKRFSSCASLAAIGIKLRTRKLAGAHGLVEINTHLRADTALQHAFGRRRCAEQSVVQDSLNACTAQNVEQMEQALDTIYRQRSQGYQHDYQADIQILDVNRSGLPRGPKAAFAIKGYFAKQRNRSGRQLGRVLASRNEVVVVDLRCEGTTQLSKALHPLMQATEQTLALDERKRARTLLCLDAGCGNLDDRNWLLSRGNQVHGKDDSSSHAQHLAQSVEYWVDDPKVPGRRCGWLHLPAFEYVRPVRRIAVYCRKANGKWGVGVLIWTLCPAEVLALTKVTAGPNADPATVLLGTLAHNVVIWAHGWLSEADPPCPLQHYGMLRMVRDVLHISGFLVLDAFDQATGLCSIRMRLEHLFSLTRCRGFSLLHTLPLLWAKLRYLSATPNSKVLLSASHFIKLLYSKTSASQKIGW